MAGEKATAERLYILAARGLPILGSEQRTNRSHDASACDPGHSLDLRAPDVDGHFDQDARELAAPRLLELLRVGVGDPAWNRSLFHGFDADRRPARPGDRRTASRFRDAAVSTLLRTSHPVAAAGRILDLDRDQLFGIGN